MRGKVIVLTGPPGAGKSTTARSLACTFEKSVHLHTDDFWHYIIEGAIEPFLPESDTQNNTVLKVISQAAFTYAAGGYTVIVDGIVGPWMLHHFTEARQAQPSIPVDYIVLRPDSATTLARATARTGKDDLVDSAAVTSMWKQFADLGSLNEHIIDTSDQDRGETVAAVASGLASGAFRLR